MQTIIASPCRRTISILDHTWNTQYYIFPAEPMKSPRACRGEEENFVANLRER